MTILNYGRLGLGAGSVGAMEQSLSDMLARSAYRVQFGVPIVSFELIREKLARAQGPRFCRLAASPTSPPSSSRPIPCSTSPRRARIASSIRRRAAWDSLYDALQTAGGAGYLATNPTKSGCGTPGSPRCSRGRRRSTRSIPRCSCPRPRQGAQEGGPARGARSMAGRRGPRPAPSPVASLKVWRPRGKAWPSRRRISASMRKKRDPGPREIRRLDFGPRIPAPAPDFAQPGRLRPCRLRRSDRAAEPCREGRRRLPRALLLPPRGGAGERESEPSLQGLRVRNPPEGSRASARAIANIKAVLKAPSISTHSQP